jgi:hypothetical protein
MAPLKQLNVNIKFPMSVARDRVVQTSTIIMTLTITIIVQICIPHNGVSPTFQMQQKL